MQEKYIYNEECEIKPCDCEMVEGNVSKSIEINKGTNISEIKVDMEVEKRKSVRIWGQIKDCKGKPVRGALVKLVKEVQDCGRKKYVGVAHGVTDCLGFYQFDVCIPEQCQYTEKYRVIASKQSLGEECVMNGSECNPCNDKENCVR